MKYSFLIALIFLSACATYDVTENETLKGGYERGDVYVAQQYMLITDGGTLIGNQNTIRRYASQVPGNGYKGLLEKGDAIKIERILLEKHPEIGVSIHPIAVVLSGEFKKDEVDLYFVSKNLNNIKTEKALFFTLTNNPKYFKKKN